MNVVKIALPDTTDVHDAKLLDLVLSSQYPSPKINTKATPPHAGIIFLDWVSTTIVVTFPATKTIYSFPHGYSYIPVVIGSYDFFDGTTYRRGTLPFQYGALAMIVIEADKTNINFKYLAIQTDVVPQPAFTMRVKFYVLAERGRE